MKYLTLSLLTVVLVAGVGVSAHEGSADNAKDRSCPPYEIGIIAPAENMDFKLVLVMPAKSLDQSMVTNPCPGQNQKTSAPQGINFLGEAQQFVRVVPAP